MLAREPLIPRTDRPFKVASIKLIRNKQTIQSERYGFIEFVSHEAADKVVQSYNGNMMPNSDQAFRLNWASLSTGEKRSEPGSDLSIFIGDLAPDVTDTMLYETFAGRYSSLKGAMGQFYVSMSARSYRMRILCVKVYEKDSR